MNRLDHLLTTGSYILRHQAIAQFRIEEENETEQGDRLQKLASFQLLMIRHAMKCNHSINLLYIVLSTPPVPRVQRIVYSTCSIHAAENEHVVRAALQTEEARSGSFELDSRENVLPQWQRRGMPKEMDDPSTIYFDVPHIIHSTYHFLTAQAASVIRCSPGEDATNGFFVSCFVRNSSSSGTIKRKLDVVAADEHKKKKRKKQRVAAA